MESPDKLPVLHLDYELNNTVCVVVKVVIDLREINIVIFLGLPSLDARDNEVLAFLEGFFDHLVES